MQSYSYQYIYQYGSKQVGIKKHKVSYVSLSKDGLSLEIKVDGLKIDHVFQLDFGKGFKSTNGKNLNQNKICYRINRLRK